MFNPKLGTNIILRWARPSTTNGPLKNYIIEMTTDGVKKVWETQVCVPIKYSRIQGN